MSSDVDDGPIVSSLAGDGAHFERLERFVVALGERVDRLQDLESARDRKQIEAEARSLGYEASQLGYPALAEAAAAVERACADAAAAPRAPSPLRASVVALTHVARRVRLGHRFVEF